MAIKPFHELTAPYGGPAFGSFHKHNNYFSMVPVTARAGDARMVFISNSKR